MNAVVLAVVFRAHLPSRVQGSSRIRVSRDSLYEDSAEALTKLGMGVCYFIVNTTALTGWPLKIPHNRHNITEQYSP